ncbi:MAG: Rv3235 family protein [Marmoricola sp.]
MTYALQRHHTAPVPMASVQGTLALQYGPPVRHRTDSGPDLHVVPGGRLELEAFARGFARVVVEVVGGDRGPNQLLRWTSEKVYLSLQERTALLQRVTPGDRRVRRLRSRVRSVHVFCPSPDAAELSVHVRQGERSRAIAARLDLVEGRWICTALEFG